ncbi:MAG TPA: hypothetical protein VLZ78_09395 [Terrimesophilobacter sp.]|nr:hypothetical protein [Terrimesophilobacter sp.]
MGHTELESRAWRIAHAGLGLDAIFTVFDELLRSQVAYAIASWSTHEPATGLFTSCTMSGAPKDPAASGEPSSYRTSPPSSRDASPPLMT